MKRNKEDSRLGGRKKIEGKREENHEDRDDRKERGKVMEERRQKKPPLLPRYRWKEVANEGKRETGLQFNKQTHCGVTLLKVIRRQNESSPF